MRIRTRKDLGTLMQDLRKRLHMTQAQLAEIVGVNRRWVVQVEQAKTNADLRTVFRALRALGVEMHVRPLHLSAQATEISEMVDSGRRSRD